MLRYHKTSQLVQNQLRLHSSIKHQSRTKNHYHRQKIRTIQRQLLI